MNKKQIVALVSLIAISACSAKVDTRGYISQKPIAEQITVGQTTRDEVFAKLGSPSSRSSFGTETWYYITQRKEGTAFMRPEIAQQQAFRIEFDGSGVVQKIDGFSEKDSQDIELVSRTTPTEGHTLGFLEQILGNIGRFNNSGTESAAPGRKPGRGAI